ncbi:MAG TPA: glycoside hydrolase family 88 protein [Acidobacteriota bacterium]|nr:glycoside hydrolase family 88 protein [Acidobacteriota bacterium]
MRRRQALKDILAAGATSGALAALGPPQVSGDVSGRSRPAADPVVGQVQLSMLGLQREAWEQGVAMQALLEWGDRDMVVRLAHGAVLRAYEDGRLGMVSDNHGVTDPAANGEGVLFAAKAAGEPRFKDAADRMLAYLLRTAPRTADGTLHHIDHKPQVWIDSMYMAPPFLAMAGAPAEAVKQVEGIRRLLWDKKARLFSHIWDDGKKAFERKAHWGVGNGWAAAGMTRVVKALPEGMKAERGRIQGYVREVLDGCLRHRRADGLFHDVVDDPATFVETNLAQMLSYTIFRGVQAGWLARAYLKEAGTMRAAARGKVDGLGYVQDVCGSPTFEKPGTATEGQAFFILMEAAARDLGA